ncbi:cupin domain-containing protein [Pseudonocardia halophobica]|uniref:cupin domain-containing protein n=1 Tax=Pseudonocardia halophobica TaxID=29401 RepID=UPI003D900CCE
MDTHVERSGDGAFGHVLHDGTIPVGVQWFFRERTQLPVAINRWSFPPGATEGVHAHPPMPGEDGAAAGELEEVYVLVRGRATLLVGGTATDLSPGDAFIAPPGLPHGVRNDGPDPAEFLVIWGPPAGGFDWSRFRLGRSAAAASGSRGADHPSTTDASAQSTALKEKT